MNEKDEEMGKGATPAKEEAKVTDQRDNATKFRTRTGKRVLVATVIVLVIAGALVGILVNKGNRRGSQNEVVNPNSNQDLKDEPPEDKSSNETAISPTAITVTDGSC